MATPSGHGSSFVTTISCSVTEPARIFAKIEDIAEGARKVGGTTTPSIGHVARLQRLIDNHTEYVDPHGMLAELRDDNLTVLANCGAVRMPGCMVGLSA